MADTAGYPPDTTKSGLGPHSDSLHTTNKRKRDNRDQGPNRPAPSSSNNASNSNDLSDQATASFLAAHNASTNDDEMQQFDVHQNGGASTASVGDTAAAALAYHQMTVPQPTELSFQTQGSGGDGASFGMGDHHQQQQTGMQDFSLEALKAATQTPRSGQAVTSDSPPNTGGHKPQVGSEEWHKVRRDNHKEGEITSFWYMSRR
jgi:bHLH factor